MSNIQTQIVDLRTKYQRFLYINWKEIFFHTSLVLGGFLAIFLIVLLKAETAKHFLDDPLLLFYTIFVTSFELSRILGAFLFKHVDKQTFQIAKILESQDDKQYEPTISFIIPCKDEENGIGKTIESCFLVDYPMKKIEVIAINDGSTDNTLAVMKEMKKEYPKLKIINWARNKGKRHGMAAGFKRARGEIVIQLDSDSRIKPEDIKNFTQPFKNPEVGAVCAHSDPLNADQNLITKMQAAYYFLSFRIFKAAESTFMTVFCCSGCASAYRKSVLLPIVDKWLNEVFLGLPVTWGDDRALTNWVIKQGYKTIYTDRVQAYTVCPDTLKKFIKQQVRWKKGWFINSIFASKFILKDHPFIATTYFFPLMFITLITPFIATRALIINPIFNGVMPFYYVAGIILVAFIVTLFYRYINRENKYWPYIFVWSGINMLILSFILIYALATIQDRRWGTR